MALPRRRTQHTEPNGQIGTAGAQDDWHTLFQIQNPADVDKFVAEHPHVVPVLRRASAEIIARFGPDVELLLEHRVDLEDEPASEYLSLGIRTDLDDEEAFTRRDQLDDEWWTDAIRDTGGDLTIDLALR